MSQPGTQTPRPALAKPSLSDKAAHGFAWMVSQAAANKVITAAGQLILAAILFPRDFGLIALTYMFTAAPVLIQQGGLREVLIQRQRYFRRWANPAFWMSIVLGFAGCILTIILAPIAGALYDNTRLTNLLLIMALFFPIESLCTVPLALLHIRMQFRYTASVQLFQSLVAVSMSILLATLHFGPYAAIAPRPIVPLIGAIAFWLKAPVRLHWHPQIRRWGQMIGDSALVLAANTGDMVILFVGYFALSITHAKTDVGHYYFAFNLSLQAIVLITFRLRGVLFPALSTLANNPQRQTYAFLRALRLISFLAVPACLLQAALSDAGVRALYDDRWLPAIPMLQVLSIGMAIRSMGWPSVSILQAQGRFGTRLVIVGVSLTTQTILIGGGLWLFGPIGVAFATTLNWAVIDPISVYVAIRPTGQGWRDVGRTLWAPVALGLLVVGPAALVGWAIPDMTGRHWWRLGLITALAIALYVPVFRTLAPKDWQELRQLLAEMLARRRQRKSGITPEVNAG